MAFRLPFLKKDQGFTKTELLGVFVILTILMVVTLLNFRDSQIKSRDAQRKADLRQIAVALEAYQNDHGNYPPSQNGQIVACGCLDQVCAWGKPPRELCDRTNLVYLPEIPDDVLAGPSQPHYCYFSDGASFQLLAKLENGNDPDKAGPFSCDQVNNYNFDVVSGK